MKRMTRLFDSFSGQYDKWATFSDFVALAAISISNSCDSIACDDRHAEYMRIIGRYDPRDREIFSRLFAALVETLDEAPTDALGLLFGALEVHNAKAGQFFTPYQLSRCMAEMLIGDGSSLKRYIEEKGYVSISEPACGAGGMVIAFAEAMRARGFEPQKYLKASCADIDVRAVHMTYIQLSLLGIMAVVEHKNTLSLEQFGSPWRTPAMMMGGLHRLWEPVAAVEGQLALFKEAI